MRIFLAQNIGKYLIGGRDTGAGINHKQARIGHANCPLCQTAHAPLQAFICGLFQSSRINNGEFQMPQTRFAFAQVASHPRLIIHQSELSPHQAVEQCGFSNIWTANNSQSKGHRGPLSVD